MVILRVPVSKRFFVELFFAVSQPPRGVVIVKCLGNSLDRKWPLKDRPTRFKRLQKLKGLKAYVRSLWRGGWQPRMLMMMCMMQSPPYVTVAVWCRFPWRASFVPGPIGTNKKCQDIQFFAAPSGAIAAIKHVYTLLGLVNIHAASTLLLQPCRGVSVPKPILVSLIGDAGRIGSYRVLWCATDHGATAVGGAGSQSRRIRMSSTSAGPKEGNHQRTPEGGALLVGWTTR
jgi:hypothetical protein